MKVFPVLLLAAIATAQEVEKEDWLWFNFEARFHWFSGDYCPLLDINGNALYLGDSLSGQFAVNLNAACDETLCMEDYAEYPTGGKILIPDILDISVESSASLSVVDRVPEKGIYIYYFYPGTISVEVAMASIENTVVPIPLDLSFFKSIDLDAFEDKSVYINSMADCHAVATIVSVAPLEPEGHCIQDCAKTHQECMKECPKLKQGKKTCKEDCKDDFEDCKSNCPRSNN